MATTRALYASDLFPVRDAILTELEAQDLTSTQLRARLTQRAATQGKRLNTFTYVCTVNALVMSQQISLQKKGGIWRYSLVQTA